MLYEPKNCNALKHMMMLKKKIANRSARSIAVAYRGSGKFANNPATTTINASAKAKTRLRILKFANSPITLDMFKHLYFYSEKLTTSIL